VEFAHFQKVWYYRPDSLLLLLEYANQPVRAYGFETLYAVLDGAGDKTLLFEITDSYVPWGVKSFTLKSTEGLSVGDNVVVYRPCTLEWIEAIGMMKQWSQPNEMNGFNFHFERQIVAIDGNRITLNAPTVNAMEDKYGGGFVYRFTEEGGLSTLSNFYSGGRLSIKPLNKRHIYRDPKY